MGVWESQLARVSVQFVELHLDQTPLGNRLQVPRNVFHLLVVGVFFKILSN